VNSLTDYRGYSGLTQNVNVLFTYASSITVFLFACHMIKIIMITRSTNISVD